MNNRRFWYAGAAILLSLVFSVKSYGDERTLPQAGLSSSLPVPIHGHSGPTDGGVLKAAPYISVWAATNVAPSSGVDTKVQLDTIQLDSGGSYFDNVTNFRWRPLVAGTYLISGEIVASSNTTLTYMTAQIKKNGATVLGCYTILNGSWTTSINFLPINMCIVNLNGTTDYIELFGQLQGTGTLSMSGYLTGIRLSF